jgi:ATP-binding cassette subfamily G (WHITE) protein 2 (SNQ2)
LHLSTTGAMDNSNHSTIREESDGKTYEAIHPETQHVKHDNDSVRTASVDNDAAPNTQQFNEKGFVDAQGGVNVHRAEQDFAELSKELSRTSQVSRRLDRVQSRHSRKDLTVTDVEKSAVASSDASSDEPFDLEKTLRGGQEDQEAAGIKSKRIGVVWDNLTVSGIGGVKNYAKVSRNQQVVYNNVKANTMARLSLTPSYRSSMFSRLSQACSGKAKKERNLTFSKTSRVW